MVNCLIVAKKRKKRFFFKKKPTFLMKKKSFSPFLCKEKQIFQIIQKTKYFPIPRVLLEKKEENKRICYLVTFLNTDVFPTGVRGWSSAQVKHWFFCTDVLFLIGKGMIEKHDIYTNMRNWVGLSTD